jgi:hypothetical protein
MLYPLTDLESLVGGGTCTFFSLFMLFSKSMKKQRWIENLDATATRTHQNFYTMHKPYMSHGILPVQLVFYDTVNRNKVSIR